MLNQNLVSMIKKFRKGARVPAVAEFIQDENHYKMLGDNGYRFLYEVTSPSGSKYWEVFEHGHLYKSSDAWYKSTSIQDGEEMYPTDEDFGRWAWCWNSLERAKRCFAYKRPQ